jgi:3alpha(or 20beta)-hydroxysteroid dehydrogenase
MDRLTKKVAIITGGARGMGAATSRLFVAEGARIAIADPLDDTGPIS